MIIRCPTSSGCWVVGGGARHVEDWEGAATDGQADVGADAGRLADHLADVRVPAPPLLLLRRHVALVDQSVNRRHHPHGDVFADLERPAEGVVGGGVGGGGQQEVAASEEEAAALGPLFAETVESESGDSQRPKPTVSALTRRILPPLYATRSAPLLR